MPKYLFYLTLGHTETQVFFSWWRKAVRDSALDHTWISFQEKVREKKSLNASQSFSNVSTPCFSLFSITVNSISLGFGRTIWRHHLGLREAVMSILTFYKLDENENTLSMQLKPRSPSSLHWHTHLPTWMCMHKHSLSNAELIKMRGKRPYLNTRMFSFSCTHTHT